MRRWPWHAWGDVWRLLAVLIWETGKCWAGFHWFWHATPNTDEWCHHPLPPGTPCCHIFHCAVGLMNGLLHPEGPTKSNEDSTGWLPLKLFFIVSMRDANIPLLFQWCELAIPWEGYQQKHLTRTPSRGLQTLVLDLSHMNSTPQETIFFSRGLLSPTVVPQDNYATPTWGVPPIHGCRRTTRQNIFLEWSRWNMRLGPSIRIQNKKKNYSSLSIVSFSLMCICIFRKTFVWFAWTKSDENNDTYCNVHTRKDVSARHNWKRWTGSMQGLN